MRQQKYFNNKKVMDPAVKNRRDADKLISASFKAFLLLGLMTLRDEFGFGPEEAERFVDKVGDLQDSYNKGYIDAKDLSGVIKEELGIEVLAWNQNGRRYGD